MRQHNNGYLIQLLRSLDLRNGTTEYSRLKTTPPVLETLDATHQAQDGGNCSNMMMVKSSTQRLVTLWKCIRVRILRVIVSTLEEATRRFTNNGISSTLTNIREILRRENSTRTSDSMLKDHSILYQLFQEEDTSKESTRDHTKNLVSSNQTVTRAKSGTSIKRP